MTQEQLNDVAFAGNKNTISARTSKQALQEQLLAMAVPKKKTSKSRRDKRRSHHALSKVKLTIDRESGEYKLLHHLDLKTGRYRGKQILSSLEPKEA